MVVDSPRRGALGIGVAVPTSFDTLLPLFEGMSAARSCISCTCWARC
jgi:hypothetical protein